MIEIKFCSLNPFYLQVFRIQLETEMDDQLLEAVAKAIRNREEDAAPAEEAPAAE